MSPRETLEQAEQRMRGDSSGYNGYGAHQPPPTDAQTFASDFIDFQKSLKPVTRNATGDDGQPYADIEAIVSYVRPRLAKHNLAVMQSEGIDLVTTKIFHISGVCETFVAKTDPSASGPTRYGRRHALMCALGIVEEPIKAKPDYDHIEQIDLQPYGMLANSVGHALLDLSMAQRLVLVRKYPTDGVALIAEAQKLGGGAK